jgi:hypothetical protein
MHFEINRDIVDSIPFDAYYRNIMPSSNQEFYNRAGKDHYRLLSYFSSLFNNSNIIDIGTHHGSSALALSYNETNTIHTFDIVDNMQTVARNRKNIQFHKENLLERETLYKWKDTILSCPFIMLDIDPHDGTPELVFYNYLKEINYNGFVICDDVWYFKGMRDEFWYKIPYEERYDVTDIGHQSGTGIISFNKDITFPKYDNSNWTLVTAYFNLTKYDDASKEIKERDNKYYFSHSISTLCLPYNLVIYCDEESIECIKAIRPDYLKDKTKYIVCDFDNFKYNKKEPLTDTFRDYRKRINKNREGNSYYGYHNRNTASYYLFCMARYIMMKETIVDNPFQSTHFAWINFCIERMGYTNLIRLDECLDVKRDKFSTCYIDYIQSELIADPQRFFKYGRCSMCSGFFTGNAEYMYKVCDLIEDKFLYYLELGYGHADEQLYSPAYFDSPELFEHYYGDYNQMITNYKYIYEAAEPPVYNFIRNSFRYKNYEKCYEACKFVFRSICLQKCEIKESFSTELHDFYMKCKKIFGEFE